MYYDNWGDFFIVDADGNSYGCYSRRTDAERAIEEMYMSNDISWDVDLYIERG